MYTQGSWGIHRLEGEKDIEIINFQETSKRFILFIDLTIRHFPDRMNYQNRKSVPSLSDIDESELNQKKLQVHEMYETRSTKLVAAHMMTGELLAKDALETVLNQAVDKIQEKYILSKQNPHVVRSTNNLIEMALGVNFTIYDSRTFEVNDDDEPVIRVFFVLIAIASYHCRYLGKNQNHHEKK